MSSLLKEAIVDAKALRESALKNAETSVIQKYSEEVKATLEQLLEQDELGLETENSTPQADVVDNVPLAATDGLSEEEGDIPNGLQEDGEEVSVNIDLEALQEAVAALEAELNEDEETELNEDEEVDLSEDEEIELNEDELAAILAEDEEELNEAPGDFGPSYTGGVAPTGDRFRIFPSQVPLALKDVLDGRPSTAGTPQVGILGLAHSVIAKLRGLPSGAPNLPDKDPRVSAVVDILKEPENLAAIKNHRNGMDLKDVDGRTSLEEYDTDALVDAIMEKLTVDMGASLAGWAGRSSEDKKYQIEKELAHRRSTEVEEEMEALKKAQEELVFENKQLTDKLSNYEGALEELQENLQDVNLSNARLLYTNRVLRNTSLNERQKDKIVEAISNAGSVTDARTIFETLQSTVEAKPKRSPQSLSEAIGNKRSSVIRASRQESTPSDPIAERMKRLAGIK